MSQADSTKKPGGLYRKPRADVYTVLLILALISLLMGITFLYLEMDLYNWEFKTNIRALLDRPTNTPWLPSTG